MKIEIPNPYKDNNCFFCGSNNIEGLKLKFYWDEEKQEASTEYLPVQGFVGQGKILHGGIQMGLLDEIMGWSSYALTKEMAVTSDLNIKFLKPVYVTGKVIRITCSVISKEGLKIDMQSLLINSDDILCTRATGTFHILDQKKYDALIQG